MAGAHEASAAVAFASAYAASCGLRCRLTGCSPRRQTRRYRYHLTGTGSPQGLNMPEISTSTPPPAPSRGVALSRLVNSVQRLPGQVTTMAASWRAAAPGRGDVSWDSLHPSLGGLAPRRPARQKAAWPGEPPSCGLCHRRLLLRREGCHLQTDRTRRVGLPAVCLETGGRGSAPIGGRRLTDTQTQRGSHRVTDWRLTRRFRSPIGALHERRASACGALRAAPTATLTMVAFRGAWA